MPGVTNWRYAPIAAFTRARQWVIVPSFVAPSVYSVTTSRPWMVAT